MHDRVSRCLLLLTLFMFLLAFTPIADLEGIAARSKTVVSNPENRGILLAGTAHGPITIDGDANFSDTALLEGWPGDGSPDNPYIIDGLDIDLSGEAGHCISISNTRVSFNISNCILIGGISDYSVVAGGGIYLGNVTNGELVNNTCTSNGGSGICLLESDSNTVSDNTCNNNWFGIYLYLSDSNSVFDNTCNNNRIGIYLLHSSSNTVINNTYTGNIQYDIYFIDSDIITEMTGEFDLVVLLLIVLVGITFMMTSLYQQGIV